jgi:sec-independent protein translocase protein TatA
MGTFGIGLGEIIFILIIALLVFGPGRLPDAAHSLGKGINWLRKSSSEASRQISKEWEEIKDDMVGKDKGEGDQKS